MESAKLISIDIVMIVQMINFLVLVYVFWKLFSKKIGKVIEDRKKIALDSLEKVNEERKKLESQKEIAEKLRKESKRRANDIIIKAERQADDRKDQIISNANLIRERMMLKAESDIIRMKENAKQELQKEVSEMVILLAEKIIKENIGENVSIQEKSINHFIEKIGN